MKSKTIKRLLCTCLVLAAALAVMTVSASACTTIYVGGNLVEEGTPFVARTEDYGSDYNKLWFIYESGNWKQGDHFTGCPAYGPFEWDFTHDSYRFTYFTNDIYYDGICPECGEKADHPSYTEFGTNAKGVSVSATETLSGNAEVKKVDPFHSASWAKSQEEGALIGIEETDIPTIILAEAATAREGVELLLSIYDKYGAVGASGIFICDKDEVWYIENCSGTQYVAIKLNDDLVFIEPNMAVIGKIDLDDENVIASEKLIAVAKEAKTFVGDEKENIIDFRASYASISSKMDQRMIDGLNFLNASYNYDSDTLVADNTKFTISNLDADGKIVPFYTNIKADRELDKDDVFNFYKLSSVGKPSNQEIEIFQLFKDRPVETATVGWVGVGNMSNNVFVPCYPMLIDDIYDGYQVSTAEATFSTERPAGFCMPASSWAQDAEGNWQRVSGYKAYPSNWKDSFYFTFEGLGGYIQYAEQLTGVALKDEAKAYVKEQLVKLQNEIYDEFVTVDTLNSAADARALATENLDKLAAKTHKVGVELVNYITSESALNVSVFTDVKLNDFFRESVNWAVEKGITTGATATTFAPNDTCTRAQAVTFLWRAAGEPEASAETAVAFTDVDTEAYYYKAILWAVENGITTGTSDTTFSPNATCTRTQIVTFLYRFAVASELDVSVGEDTNILSYVDALEIPEYAMTAFQWAVGEGVMQGSDGNLLPNAACTRGQMVTFLYRALAE